MLCFMTVGLDGDGLIRLHAVRYLMITHIAATMVPIVVMVLRTIPTMPSDGVW